MAVQIQIRRGSASNWTASNPILAEGEMGLELDTGKLKFGDGVTAWNSLAYSIGTDGADGADADPSITMGAVIHGTNASAARPAGYVVVSWVGTVEPLNAINGDIWYNIS